MKLSPRYSLDILFVVAAAFLAVAAMAFTGSLMGWTAFGVFTGLTVIAIASAITTRQGGQRLGHSAIAAVGLWSLIAALIFTGSALTWLVLAGAIVTGVLALADLTAHETQTENVVHRLEVTASAPAQAQRQPVAASAPRA